MGELPQMQCQVQGRLVDVRYVSEASCCIRVRDAAGRDVHTRDWAERVPRRSEPLSPVLRDYGPVPARTFVGILVSVDTLAAQRFDLQSIAHAGAKLAYQS